MEEWIEQKKALAYLKEHEIIRTGKALNSFMLRKGKGVFVKKANDGHHWEYSFSKLKEYVELVKKETEMVKSGKYMSVSDLSNRDGVVRITVYRNIEEYEVDTVQIGKAQYVLIEEYDKKVKGI